MAALTGRLTDLNLAPAIGPREPSVTSVWLVNRRGGRWRKVVDGETEDLLFLSVFPFRGRSVFACRRGGEPPELAAWRIVER